MGGGIGDVFSIRYLSRRTQKNTNKAENYIEEYNNIFIKQSPFYACIMYQPI